jgi:glutathione S-transferase
MLKLYYAETLSPRKACAAARYLDVPVEFIRVDLARGEHQTPTFRHLNPNAAVPVLVEGERALWESNAIMCRLSDIAGADFWPREDRQIEVLKWLSWDAAHFTRFGATLWFENLVRPAIGLGEADSGVVEQATASFRRSAKNPRRSPPSVPVVRRRRADGRGLRARGRPALFFAGQNPLG